MLRVPLHADRRTVLIHACFATAIAATLAMPVAAALLGYGVWILQRISNLFRVNLYTRLQELSVKFHSQEKIGDAIYRMFQDSAAIPQVINGLIIQPLILIPAAIGSLVYLALYDFRMALIAALLIPSNFILAWIFGGPLRRAFIGEREAAAQATTRIEETLASIKAVKAFGTETPEAELYASDNWNAFIAARRARLMLAVYRVTTNTIRGLAYVAAMYVGAAEVLAGGTAGIAHAAVSLGLFQGSLGLVASVSRRMRNITDLWGSMQDVVVAISRVLEMLGKVPEQTASGGHKIPPKTAQALNFDKVSFGYDPRTPVLTEVSFAARVGEITAIAGASGSGKSTIIGLIVRFFDPITGSVRLDARGNPRIRSGRMARDAVGCAAGESAFYGDPRGQRGIRTPGRVAGRGPPGDRACGTARLRARTAGRVGHEAWRERIEAIDRTGAANRSRSRDPAQLADSSARRTDLGSRRRDRGCGDARIARLG